MGFSCCSNTSNEIFIDDLVVFCDHFNKIHFGRKRSSQEFKCPLCKETLFQKYNLPNHFQIFHPDKVNFLFNEFNLPLQKVFTLANEIKQQQQQFIDFKPIGSSRNFIIYNCK